MGLSLLTHTQTTKPSDTSTKRVERRGRERGGVELKQFPIQLLLPNSILASHFSLSPASVTVIVGAGRVQPPRLGGGGCVC